ncbi:MAG: TlyA family RNA methyltransferase [Candidatus Coatesbacteria bacterium]|nr:MAG: TlyA family RNA methyltransferase [Candidatus Coatesbacteria bacterium]
MPKTKLVDLLIARGLVNDEKKARALIMAGRVVVNGSVVDKPGTPVAEDAAVEIKGREEKYASRGGEKLAAALDAFPVVVAGRVCIDVGASTGGFTSCLLDRGAELVYAVDVGKGLLAWELRNDPRVVAMEGVNVRYFDAQSLAPKPTLLVADVSFISLTAALEKLITSLAAIEDAVVLIKPQFEALKEDVEPGGVVTDPAVIRDAIKKMIDFFERMGFGALGVLESPGPGPAGNREFLLWAARDKGAVVTSEDITSVLSD